MLKSKNYKINIKEIKKFFKKKTIKKIANETGFILRNRNVDSFNFF